MDRHVHNEYFYERYICEVYPDINILIFSENSGMPRNLEKIKNTINITWSFIWEIAAAGPKREEFFSLCWTLCCSSRLLMFSRFWGALSDQFRGMRKIPENIHVCQNIVWIDIADIFFIEISVIAHGQVDPFDMNGVAAYTGINTVCIRCPFHAFSCADRWNYWLIMIAYEMDRLCSDGLRESMFWNTMLDIRAKSNERQTFMKIAFEMTRGMRKVTSIGFSNDRHV